MRRNSGNRLHLLCNTRLWKKLAGSFCGIACAILFAHGQSALAANYKKDYCGGNEYVGNAGGKYPHIHCTKTVFTLSRSKTNHINLHEKGNCKKVDEILGDSDRYYGSANDVGAITGALQAYRADDCP